MKVNSKWTLFLDRDGVINERIPNDYVRTPDQFNFIEGSPKAIARLSNIFGITVVVTNQQGIGKGLMTETDLSTIHTKMVEKIESEKGTIHKIYHCPHLAKNHPDCRKPNSGMAFQAKKDFPQINFKQSFMVGDSISDMEFGHRLGMTTVYITSSGVEIKQIFGL